MKSLLIGAGAVLLASSGCQKEERPSTEIFGEWQWVSSTGGFTGNQVLTPASTKQILRYTFGRDSMWANCSNGQCSEATKFTLRTELSRLLGKDALILTLRQKVYLARPDTGFRIIKLRYLVEEISDELHLSMEAADGYRERYKRR